MRILQLARYGSVKGGTEAYVAELCRGLRQAGHEVALGYRFDPDDARPEVRAGVQIAALTSRSEAPSAIELAELTRAVTSFRPDVVHAHNVEAAWLPAALLRLAPVVTAVHDHRLDCPTGTRYWAAWNKACTVTPGAGCLAYNLAAHCGSLRANATLEPFMRWRRLHRAAVDGPAIQVFSEHMKDAIRRAGIRALVTVTPYPCPALPDAAPVARDDARPLVFATGRATKEKGFDLLLDALPALQRPVHVVLAGQGHHLAALRHHAARVPQRHRVQFLGWLDRERLAAWYAAADVVAVPSAWPEPFGIVGLEAMAAGKPVVATEVGGVREWLVPGETGFAVAPRDAAGFAAALGQLLADSALRERMGAAASARVEALHTLDCHIDRVVEMYRHACRGWEKAA
ncbi:MAG: glycosyltransferase family 4 protein [Actinomycetota bacterium]